VQQWKDWSASAVPAFNDMKAENQRLENLARIRMIAVSSLGFGIGIALFCSWLFWRWFRQVRPIPTAKKQLAILLLTATWITACVFIALSDGTLSTHPINMAVIVFMYSLPAILFGGIAVGWIGRKSEVIKLW
jgi:hypothetical protein